MSVDNGIAIAPAPRVGTAIGAPRPRIAPADLLWRRRSIRAQLLITILLIDLIAAIAACAVIIMQTRTSVQVEVASSMKLADLLVQESIQMQQDAPAERILPNLPLQLRFLRHVRIAVHDLAGNVVTLNDTADGARGDDRPAAPSWFAALMAVPVERHEFPVEVKGRRFGAVIVTGEPKDEIAEAWEHTAALGLIALILNAAGIGLLYLLFGRVLEPVARLAGGLGDLERRNYEVRLPPPEAAEGAQRVPGSRDDSRARGEPAEDEVVQLGHSAAEALRIQSACKGGNHACKGQNACKGQGFAEMTKADYTAAKGKFKAG